MISKTEELRKIGGRLSVCRQNKNMTQEELAKRLGVTPQALSKWERGISLPDTAILPDIAHMLETSIDYLLGISERNGVEEKADTLQAAIGENLRRSSEPLELLFGKELIPLFMGENYVEEIRNLRLQLSGESFLLPVLRIRDELTLGEREFRLLSYQKILLAESVDCMNAGTLHGIAEKIGDCVRSKYYEILDPDLMCGLVDHLRSKYPVLIEGVVPEKISYHLLADMVKRILQRGGSIICLPKIIETMAVTLEWKKTISVEELEDAVYHFGRNKKI